MSFEDMQAFLLAAPRDRTAAEPLRLYATTRKFDDQRAMHLAEVVESQTHKCPHVDFLT